MARKIFSKVMWVGRTAATVLGLALVLALVFGVATTAIGATGGKFILGKANGATTVSKLTASIAGPALTLVNKSTEAAATALNISVAEGKAPLKVNATAGTATNLSADELDGEDSAAYQRRVSGECPAGQSIRSIGADGASVTCEPDDGGGKAPDSDLLDGKDSTQFANATHPHSGADITSGTVAETRIDGAVTRDSEVMPTVKANDGAGSGVDADTVDGQSSGAFASSTHNHDGRYYSSGSKVADSDKLDGKDSSVFGIRTEHNWVYAHDCDTPNFANKCAPVTVTVPAGKKYYVSVWSSFSAKFGFGTSGTVAYCSAGEGAGISTTNPCITPFGHDNRVRFNDYLSAVSSSGESVPLDPGTYTFFTKIAPPIEFAEDYDGVVITKVMVRDAANGL